MRLLTSLWLGCFQLIQRVLAMQQHEIDALPVESRTTIMQIVSIRLGILGLRVDSVTD